MVDALSRMTPTLAIHSLTIPSLLDVNVILNEVEKDEEFQKIIAILKEDPEGKPKYQWVQGKLLYKGRLVLSSSSSLIPSILHTYHDSIVGGHSGHIKE